MIILASLLMATPAWAIDWTVGAGAGYAPDYDGSADYAAVPLWGLRAGNLYGPSTYVDLFATKLTSNLLPHPHLRLGPLVEYIPKRGHVENNAVDDLQNVDPALMVGGLLGWDFMDEPDQAVGVELQARGDVPNGHGYLVTPAIRLRRAFAGQLTLAGALVSTYASEDYMSDYFGVDAANAARSGLDRYDADAGFKDAGVDLLLGFGQGPGWRASLIGRYRRLLNDAADSPIVKDEGDRDQYFAGAVVDYRF
jgi:outer membrane scaffolding protein for murein synthesis (MipA/OmpV family)